MNNAYWTVGVVELSAVRASPQRLELSLGSYAPAGTRFDAALGDGDWMPVANPTRFIWSLDRGSHRLRLRTVSPGGVKGPESTLSLGLE